MHVVARDRNGQRRILDELHVHPSGSTNAMLLLSASTLGDVVLRLECRRHFLPCDRTFLRPWRARGVGIHRTRCPMAATIPHLRPTCVHLRHLRLICVYLRLICVYLRRICVHLRLSACACGLSLRHLRQNQGRRGPHDD
jgi:hypothetical protein